MIGIALFSVRGMNGVAKQLELASELGVKLVEPYWENVLDQDEFAPLLKQHGMVCPTGQFLLHQLEDGYGRTVDRAKALGIEYLILAATPDGERHFDADGWERLGQRLGAIATRLAKDGLKFAYHNHDWEFARLESGRYALDALLDGAGAAPIYLQIDLGWLVRAGVDIPQFLSRHKERLISLHLKDPNRDGSTAIEAGWTWVGNGLLDVRQMVSLAEQLGIQPLYIEHDAPADPEQFVRKSFAYLSQEGLHA